MSTKVVIERYYQFLQQRDRTGLISLLSPEIEVIYHASNSRLPWAGIFKGINGFDRFFDTIKAHLDIVDVVVIDRVFSENKAIMQCQGTWRRKATGTLIEGAMVNVFTIEDRLINTYEVYADTAAFEAAMND